MNAKSTFFSSKDCKILREEFQDYLNLEKKGLPLTLNITSLKIQINTLD